ncbi:hypothetical protein GQ42DRAFT_162150 [Ramicandelaber brevisporus]|nr:hypothetical protein GQ42DRAFT_162150 [Ramicandelaber brevisporus]
MNNQARHSRTPSGSEAPPLFREPFQLPAAATNPDAVRTNQGRAPVAEVPAAAAAAPANPTPIKKLGVTFEIAQSFLMKEKFDGLNPAFETHLARLERGRSDLGNHYYIPIEMDKELLIKSLSREAKDYAESFPGATREELVEVLAAQYPTAQFLARKLSSYIDGSALRDVKYEHVAGIMARDIRNMTSEVQEGLQLGVVIHAVFSGFVKEFPELAAKMSLNPNAIKPNQYQAALNDIRKEIETLVSIPHGRSKFLDKGSRKGQSSSTTTTTATAATTKSKNF